MTAHPTVTLDLSGDTETVKLRSPGASLLFVENEGSYRCFGASATNEVPEVSLSGFSGEVKVYLGRRGGGQVEPSIELEDLARPHDLGWDKIDESATISLKSAPKSPQLYSLTIPKVTTKIEGRSLCSFENYFRPEADMVLQISKPVHNLEVTALSTIDTAVMLMGPLPKDQRNPKEYCFKSSVARFGRLEPGTYAVKVGTAKRTTSALVTMMLRDSESDPDPLLIAPKVPSGLSLVDRDLRRHFVMLTKDDVLDHDGIRQELFARAPKGLFVFPKYDLDEKSATFIPRVGTDNDQSPPEDAPVAYPRENEALLATAGWYMTAEGNLYEINGNDIALKPSGEVFVPGEARSPGLSFAYSLNSARAAGSSKEKKLVGEYERASASFDACRAKIWLPMNRKIDAIERGPYSEARARQADSLERAANKKVKTQCSEPYSKKEAALLKKFMAARTDRRTAKLAKIAAHVRGLFG